MINVKGVNLPKTRPNLHKGEGGGDGLGTALLPLWTPSGGWCGSLARYTEYRTIEGHDQNVQREIGNENRSTRYQGRRNTLWGLEARLQCPLLLLFGEDEIAQTNKKLFEETVRYLDALTCARTVHLFTREEGAASHCQMGGLSRAQSVIFPWLEAALNRETTAQAGKEVPVVNIPSTFFALLEKYHGREIVRELEGLNVFRR